MSGSSSNNDGSAFIAGNLAQRNPQLANLMQQYGGSGGGGGGTQNMAINQMQWDVLTPHGQSVLSSMGYFPSSGAGRRDDVMGLFHGGASGSPGMGGKPGPGGKPGTGGTGGTGGTPFNWAFPQYSQTWAFTPPAPSPYINPPPFVNPTTPAKKK